MVLIDPRPAHGRAAMQSFHAWGWPKTALERGVAKSLDMVECGA